MSPTHQECPLPTAKASAHGGATGESAGLKITYKKWLKSRSGLCWAWQQGSGTCLSGQGLLKCSLSREQQAGHTWRNRRQILTQAHGLCCPDCGGGRGGNLLTGTFQGPQHLCLTLPLCMESSLSGIFSALHVYHLHILQVQAKRHPLLEFSVTAQRKVVTFPSPRYLASIKVRSKKGVPPFSWSNFQAVSSGPQPNPSLTPDLGQGCPREGGAGGDPGMEGGPERLSRDTPSPAAGPAALPRKASQCSLGALKARGRGPPAVSRHLRLTNPCLSCWETVRDAQEGLLQGPETHVLGRKVVLGPHVTREAAREIWWDWSVTVSTASAGKWMEHTAKGQFPTCWLACDIWQLPQFRCFLGAEWPASQASWDDWAKMIQTKGLSLTKATRHSVFRKKQGQEYCKQDLSSGHPRAVSSDLSVYNLSGT